MKEIFLDKDYKGPKLRSQTDFELPYVNTVHDGIDSLRFFGPKVWNMVPEQNKNSTSLDNFKKDIKKWIPTNCPCRICKRYIQGVGYI